MNYFNINMRLFCLKRIMMLFSLNNIDGMNYNVNKLKY